MQWDKDLAIIPIPIIFSIRPHSALLNAIVSINVTGANLGASTFSFGSALLPVTVNSIAPDNSAASLSVSASAIGHYGLVATNGAGSSSSTISSANSFCILAGSSVADADLDGLTDAQEIGIGIDPCRFDTDGDGFSDGVEVATGSDPADPSSTPFTGRIPGSTWDLMASVNNASGSVLNGTGEVDGLVFVLNSSANLGGVGEVDGLFFLLNSTANSGQPREVDNLISILNSSTGSAGVLLTATRTGASNSAIAPQDEALTVSDNRSALIASLTAEIDTDGDGLSDEEERQRGLDPSSPDTDGDGYPDGLEVILGSDPLDPDSIPDSRPASFAAGPILEIQNVASPDPQAKVPVPKKSSKGNKSVVQLNLPRKQDPTSISK